MFRFQLNRTIVNIAKEDGNYTLIQFVSVLGHQTLLSKLRTTAEEYQKLL